MPVWVCLWVGLRSEGGFEKTAVFRFTMARHRRSKQDEMMWCACVSVAVKKEDGRAEEFSKEEETLLLWLAVACVFF